MTTPPPPPAHRPQTVMLGMLLVLLLCDLGFIALHVVTRASEAVERMHRLDIEGSYAEQFQYAKEFSAAVGLAALAWYTRMRVYGAWSLLFLYLLLDDNLSLHECGGVLLAEQLALTAMLGLRPQDLGELAVSFGAGSILLGAIALFHRSAAEAHRSVSTRLLALLIVLVFFGIGVDMLHIALQHLPVKGLTVIEDGGEMIAMSLIVYYVGTRAIATCGSGTRGPRRPASELRDPAPGGICEALGTVVGRIDDRHDPGR